MSKLIIAGSRSIKDYSLVKNIVDEIVDSEGLDISCVISGRAYGVDRLGEQWAAEYNIKVDEMPADWDNVSNPDAVVRHNQRGNPYNVLAGHWRNEDMAKKGDILILIHDGESKGSLNMLQCAEKHGLQIFKRVVDIVTYTKKTKHDSYLQAVNWAKKMREDETTLVLDTESCGGSKNDEIISLAVVRLHDGKPMFNSLFKPSSDVKFNWYATQVHGITKDRLMSQPVISEVWSEVYDLLHGKNVLAYNHSSDKRMIEQTLVKHSLDKPEINWYCIMRAYKNFTQSGVVTNLTTACNQMNVKAGTHDALDDALAAARVVHRIAQEYKKT